jgi:cytoskeleton-associated protein 5
MKEFPAWFENRDKGVRTEASQMVVEMYRWLGKALNPAVEALNAVQV